MPPVKMTKMTRTALFCLRFYLLLLVSLLVVRFVFRR
jgi:hypothetical protein